ncbi:MAG: FkbM family methyltransferase [Spirochaetaceae bacterium]|nr:FkbM family methyltransferase [Spirochaetaceae bacterium]
MDDLTRIGNKYDGGYILSKRQINKTEIVFSFGIWNNWAFEEDFSKRKDVAVYSYDYSTLALLQKSVSSRIFWFFAYLAAAAYHLIRLRPSRVLDSLQRSRLKSNFYRFFNGRNKKYYIAKFISEHDDETNVCFDTIFKELGEVKDLSIFLKMDIEGAEYACLPQLAPYFDKINGMAVEFHGIGAMRDRFEELLDKFSEKFYVSHIHGSNYAKLIEGADIPEVLEISFINKKIAPGGVALSEKRYPVKGLDNPCNPYKKDCALRFV